jgi:murein DD-endopeptidase MepM/ murein hydrolase activator NlpD
MNSSGSVLSAAMRAFFFFLLAILLAGGASAEKIYTSRDKSGNLVFSDKPIAGTQVVSVQQVEVAKGPCFSVSQRGEQNNLQIQGVNDCHGPVEFEFTLDEAVNMALNRPRTFRAVVPARANQSLVHLWQDNKQQGYSYRFSHASIIGDPKANHAPSQPYLLPIPAGQSFPISQAFKGIYTHTHPQSEYAVDIPMPEGTRLYAARAGTIMEVAMDFFTGWAELKYGEKANFIRILHDDGTMALYAHLRVESIQYPVGSRVARGQFIAESGNTGWSTGPHLHFAIQKNFGMELRSVPFEFEGTNGGGFTPEAGMTVRR